MNSLEQSKMKLKFLGGAGGVTGSKNLLEVGKEKYFIDYGLFQGSSERRERNTKTTSLVWFLFWSLKLLFDPLSKLYWKKKKDLTDGRTPLSWKRRKQTRTTDNLTTFDVETWSECVFSSKDTLFMAVKRFISPHFFFCPHANDC